MYKLLNQLQIDGQHMFLLNRDDQAGFRIDTTYTHKNFATLTKEKTVTHERILLVNVNHIYKLRPIISAKLKTLLKFVWVL